ncbi:unnamed protein product [Effrenium voratum]|nr:unnamed protein product [Effrenium voratum]
MSVVWLSAILPWILATHRAQAELELDPVAQMALAASKPLTHLQLVMGGTFFGMGLGTMLLPSLVMDTCFNPTYFSGTVGERVLVGCFGAQATLQGILLLSCRFCKRTWVYWGLGILPFVVFDAYACPWGPLPVLTWLGAAGDGLGNAIFLAACYLGYHRTDDGDDETGAVSLRQLA